MSLTPGRTSSCGPLSPEASVKVTERLLDFSGLVFYKRSRSEVSLDPSGSHQICCSLLRGSGLGATVENRSEVSGLRTTCCCSGISRRSFGPDRVSDSRHRQSESHKVQKTERSSEPEWNRESVTMHSSVTELPGSMMHSWTAGQQELSSFTPQSCCQTAEKRT